MIRTQAICSLTEFLRNTKAHIADLKKTGYPEVLTVNGQAELVVQDAAAYQELLDKIESIEAVRKGLEAMQRGQGKTVEQFFEAFENKHKIPKS